MIFLVNACKRGPANSRIELAEEFDNHHDLHYRHQLLRLDLG